MSQVSSRGCSRAYILCVLFRALKYVRIRRMGSQPVTFPFNSDEIEKWLVDSKEDCSHLEFQRVYGGTELNPADPSTFWTSSTHFFTWWKNNIERKSKFLSLLQDSCYNGDDEKGLSRAMFCRQAIALSINIKNHFERVLNQQLDRRILVQVTPPYRMPAQLEKWFPTVPSCPQCDGSNSAMVEDVESVDTVGICSKCVHFLEYDEYARSVIQSRGARVYRKRTDRSSSSVGRPWIRTKKARLDECYVPSASTTRSITRKYPSPGGVRVGVRASTRVSTRPGAPRDLSDPFTTGSTLALLKMKRCNVTTRRPVDSDDSSEGGDSRGDFRHGSDEAAAENDRHRDMDFEERYESQYMFDGAFLQRLSTPDLFRCYLGGGDAVDDSLATSASSSGLTISTTEEEARGEEGDGENYINAVTMEDGRSLRDFLVSCYRDGMYPSPGYSTAVAAQHGGQHFLSGGTDEQHPTTSSLKSTGTETDSCFTNDLREQLTEDCSFRLPEPSGATGPAENETDEARATAAGIAEEDLLMLSTILH